MPAKLYRVEEITTPGILPVGHYLATIADRVLVEVTLDRPTLPSKVLARLLKPRPA